MYWIGKKDSHEAYEVGHLTWQSPAFRWRLHNPRSEATELNLHTEKPGASIVLQQLVSQLAAHEEEILTLALRHAQSSGSFFDRMRGRYRQLLLPLQAEARQAIQFLVLQAVAITQEKHPEIPTCESLVQHVYGSSAETVRTHLAEYFAQPSAPGEVFAHRVWELIQGARERERFAVFALRMESCLRRLLVEIVPVLEACTIPADGVALGTFEKDN